MPDAPPNIRKTASWRMSCRRCSRMIDKMHNENFRAHMSEEEKIAAEKSINAYINPLELCFRLQDRAKQNPLFLQRSLNYQIEAKHQRRIQMSLLVSGSIDAAGIQAQEVLPHFILLAKVLVSSKPTAEDSTVYKFSRAYNITEFDGQANFLLPDMSRLALKAESLVILFISFAGKQDSQFGIDSSKIPPGGNCLWSKIPLESLYSSWQKNPNMDLGEKTKSVSLVEMQPCFIKLSMGEKRVTIQVPSNPLASSSPKKLQVTISAQEVGATSNPPYSAFVSRNDNSDHNPASSVLELPITWLRKGQVVYNFKYYNNKLHKTEVTEDFTCPICLVKCASFKGLKCHMPSTHYLFDFEIWVSERYPAVDVSLKSEKIIKEFFALNINKTQIQINEAYYNARLEPFFSLSKKSGLRKQKTPVRNPTPGPLKITDDADDSVKSEKSQIPPGSAEPSIQLDPPRSPVEVQMMQMWKSFVMEHRVFADDRIAWGCEEFSKLYGPLLIQNPDLRWPWTKYIWTLKIYSRIDPQTVKNCTALIGLD